LKKAKQELDQDHQIQKKLDLNGISKIDQEYIIKYSQYINYYSVQRLGVLQVPTRSKQVGNCKFPYLPLHQTLTFFTSIANQ
jgi:hypothetical protein